MDKRGIELPGSTKYGPYSAGVQAGNTFWLSGQIAVDFEGVKAQTQGALDKIDTLLENAGLTRKIFVLLKYYSMISMILPQ